MNPGLIDALAKAPNFFRIERLAGPAIGILAEDLQGLASMHLSAIDSPRDAAGHRHMRADAEHDPV